MTNEYPKAWQDRARELYPYIEDDYLILFDYQRAAYLRGLSESKVLEDAFELLLYQYKNLAKDYQDIKNSDAMKKVTDYNISVATQALATFPNAEQK